MKAFEPNEVIATIQRGAEDDAITIGAQRIDGFFDQNTRQARAVAIHENNAIMPGLEQRVQTYLQHLADIICLTQDELPIRGEQFAQRCAAVPGMRLERLEECGHMLHHDQPAAVAQLLESFFA